MQKYLDIFKQTQGCLFTINQILSQNTTELPSFWYFYTVFIQSSLLHKSTSTWKFAHKSESEQHVQNHFQSQIITSKSEETTLFGRLQLDDFAFCTVVISSYLGLVKCCSCWPEMWWRPHPWRHSRPNLMEPWAMQSSWRCSWSLQGSWIRWSLRIPSNLVHSVIMILTIFPMLSFCFKSRLNSPSLSHTDLSPLSYHCSKCPILMVSSLSHLQVFHSLYKTKNGRTEIFNYWELDICNTYFQKQVSGSVSRCYSCMSRHTHSILGSQ